MNPRRLFLAIFCAIQLALLLGILCFSKEGGASTFVASPSAALPPRIIPRRAPRAPGEPLDPAGGNSRQNALRELKAVEGGGPAAERAAPAEGPGQAAGLRSFHVRLKFLDVIRPTPEAQLVAVLIRTDGAIAISSSIDTQGSSNFEEVPAGRYSVEVRSASDPLESEIDVEPGELDCLGNSSELAFELRCRVRSPGDR